MNKKFKAGLVALALVAALATISQATNFSSGSTPPSAIRAHGQANVYGSFPGAVVSGVTNYITDVNVGWGDVVDFTSNTGNGISVSKTTAANSQTIAGIVTYPLNGVFQPYPATGSPNFLSLTAALGAVDVAWEGVTMANICVNVTKGDNLSSSGIAGYLTESGGTGIMTPASRTAVVCVALETKTVTAGVGMCRVKLVGR